MTNPTPHIQHLHGHDLRYALACITVGQWLAWPKVWPRPFSELPTVHDSVYVDAQIAEATADALVGQPVDSHVSRAYTPGPVCVRYVFRKRTGECFVQQLEASAGVRPNRYRIKHMTFHRIDFRSGGSIYNEDPRLEIDETEVEVLRSWVRFIAPDWCHA